MLKRIPHAAGKNPSKPFDPPILLSPPPQEKIRVTRKKILTCSNNAFMHTKKIPEAMCISNHFQINKFSHINYNFLFF